MKKWLARLLRSWADRLDPPVPSIYLGKEVTAIWITPTGGGGGGGSVGETFYSNSECRKQ